MILSRTYRAKSNDFDQTALIIKRIYMMHRERIFTISFHIWFHSFHRLEPKLNTKVASFYEHVFKKNLVPMSKGQSLEIL